MECKICHKFFELIHFAQKYCNEECRHKARIISLKKFAKTEKGLLLRQKWRKTDNFKISQKKYRSRPEVRRRAVIRATKHLKNCIRCQKAKAIRDKLYPKTEIGIKNIKKAAKKYRQSENGKWKRKQYKYYLRNNQSGKIDKNLWEEKLIKLEGKCQMCGTKNNITIDHIIPLSKGGLNDINNLQPLCFSCNRSKNNK